MTQKLNNWRTEQGDSTYNNRDFKTQNRWYKAENNRRKFQKKTKRERSETQKDDGVLNKINNQRLTTRQSQLTFLNYKEKEMNL